MTQRPDFSIIIMAGIAVFVGVAAGIGAKFYGLTTDVMMLMANIGFTLCCYLTTFAFSIVLNQQKLDEIIKKDAKQEVDVADLFNGRLPSSKVAAERIWAHKSVSRYVLIKAYAADTRAVVDRIVNYIFFTILFLIVASGAIVLRSHLEPAAPGMGTTSSGIAPSLLILVATLTFAIFRVYIPVKEVAQRNLTVLTDA